MGSKNFKKDYNRYDDEEDLRNDFKQKKKKNKDSEFDKLQQEIFKEVGYDKIKVNNRRNNNKKFKDKRYNQNDDW